MSKAQSRVSPIVAIAAVSLIVFSIVGVGVMTGVIPSSRSTETVVQVSDTKAGQRATAKLAQAAQRPSSAPRAAKPVPTQIAAVEPTPAVSPMPVVAAPVVAAPYACADCGVIDAISIVEQKGEGSWMGKAGGAVVGGLIGTQVGNGRGKTVATVAGAVGGALLGNEIEKHVRKTKQYNVSVRMDDGNFRTFNFESAHTFAVGEKVKVIDGRILRS
jgi:outer membrane lipoprotein SlyB